MSCCHHHHPTRRRVLVLGAAAALLPLAACDHGPETGAVAVHWDRDTCVLCRMMISDAKFTAQVRGGPGRDLVKFDDIGCAINWLNDQPWAGDPETEIWIADHASTRERVVWLNARAAWYRRGPASPMAYNFAASATPGDGALRFEDLTGAILANAPNHICPLPAGYGRGEREGTAS